MLEITHTIMSNKKMTTNKTTLRIMIALDAIIPILGLIMAASFTYKTHSPMWIGLFIIIIILIPTRVLKRIKENLFALKHDIPFDDEMIKQINNKAGNIAWMTTLIALLVSAIYLMFAENLNLYKIEPIFLILFLFTISIYSYIIGTEIIKNRLK